MKSTPAAISVAMAVSVYTVVLGIIYPYLALNLSEIGAPTYLIGINASMVPIGLLAASLTYRHLLLLLSPLQIAIYSIIMSAGLLYAIFTFEVIENYSVLLVAWIPLCILLGFVVNGLFIIGEAWINRLASDEIRGRILGFYTTALIAGYGVGPLFIGLFGHDGKVIAIISIVFIILALVPIFIYRKTLKTVTFETVNNVRSVETNRGFILSNGLIVLCFASIAVFDNVAISFMPLYFSNFGFNLQQASWSLSLIIFGGAAFQPFVGYAADKISNSSIILLSSVLTIICSVVLMTIGQTPYLFVILILWGGAAFANYTLALKELGDSYSDERLVTGSAVLAMTWSLVTIVGLPMIGTAIGLVGIQYFPVFISLIYPIVVIALFFRKSIPQ